MMMNKLFNVLVLHFLLYRGGGFFIFQKKKTVSGATRGGGEPTPPQHISPPLTEPCVE